jgi:hypothetical protein
VSQWLVQHGAQSVEISFSERIAPAKGLSYGGKIKLLSGMQPAEDTKEKIPQHSVNGKNTHSPQRSTLRFHWDAQGEVSGTG